MLLLTMLNQYLIEKLTNELKIAPLNIIREYLEMEVLHRLSQSKLSENVIFYGGTALRLAYHSFRFSEDLDFLYKKEQARDKKELENVLKKVCEENEGVSVEEVIHKRWTLFGLLRIKKTFLKHPIRIKIEVSKKTNGVQSENLLVVSPVSVKEVVFPTATLESLLKLKEKAIRVRNVPRDWFDYWHICQKLRLSLEIRKPLPFSKNEFSRELRRWLPRDKWRVIDAVLRFYQI